MRKRNLRSLLLFYYFEGRVAFPLLWIERVPVRPSCMCLFRDLANQAAGMKRVLLRGRQCDLSLRQSA